VGLNQGGYAVVNLDSTHPGLFRDHLGILRNRLQFTGQREGWLNLGGFAQYRLLPDEAAQFLLTAGMRWEAPSGSKAIFQGIGPVHLAPYVTAGKGFGDFHLLTTVGYQFPAGSGSDTNLFYGSAHLDLGVWLVVSPGRV
jgi:hypothetical protein